MPPHFSTCNAVFALASILALKPSPAPAQDVTSSDLFAPHVSTLAANPGQHVGIHIHRTVAAQPVGQVKPDDRVVLFVHGATTPGTAAFALDYKDYNWMTFLARAGFDVWAMDMSGYGSSPRPMMDDPCNVDLKQQEIIVKRPLPTMCTPHYALKFKTSRDDWAEIDSTVEFIRRATGAQKVGIIAWSAGGSRAGGYAALHPDKVNRIVFYAPGGPRPGYRPPERPEAGFPVALQTRADLEKKRWDPEARCTGQVEPGVRDALWAQIMQWDHVGSTWGPEEGVMRAPTMMNGWSTEQAHSLKMPVMVIVGEYDTPDARHAVYDSVGSTDKVFVKVACASHFMLWEKQHKTLHDASLEWLRDGKFRGSTHAEFEADADGNVKKAE